MEYSIGNKLKVTISGREDASTAYYVEPEQRTPGHHTVLVMPENQYTLVDEKDIVASTVNEDMPASEVKTRVDGTTELNNTNGIQLAQINNRQVEEFKEAEVTVNEILGLEGENIQARIEELTINLQTKLSLPTMYESAESLKSDQDLLSNLQDKTKVAQIPEQPVSDDTPINEQDNSFLTPFDTDQDAPLDEDDFSEQAGGARVHPELNTNLSDEELYGPQSNYHDEMEVSGWGAVGHGVGSLLGAAAAIGTSFAHILRNPGLISQKRAEYLENKYDSYVSSASLGLSQVEEFTQRVKGDSEVTGYLDQLRHDDGSLGSAESRLDASDNLSDVMHERYGLEYDLAIETMQQVGDDLSKAYEFADNKFDLRADMATELFKKAKEAEEENSFLTRLTQGSPDEDKKLGFLAELFKKIRESVQEIIQSIGRESNNEARLGHAPRM